MTEDDLIRWCGELWFYWETCLWRDDKGLLAGCAHMRLRPTPLPPMRRDRRQFRTTVRELLDWLGWLQRGTTLPGTVAHVYLCRSHLRQALYSLDREHDRVRMWPMERDRVLVVEELNGTWRLELAGIPPNPLPADYRPPVWPQPYPAFPRWRRQRYDGG